VVSSPQTQVLRYLYAMPQSIKISFEKELFVSFSIEMNDGDRFASHHTTTLAFFVAVH
jgi:hypothetical protein